MSSSSSSTLPNATIFCIIALLGQLVLVASTDPLPLAQQLRIWKCRQRCYHQTDVSPSLCHARPDCYMCHDYCRVLVVAEWSLARSMCADRIFCSRGCRTACQFHRLHTATAAPFANALHKA
ncbi:hypothetical protein AWZ03_010247 [Drosophila navojoa]|uniref:Uncharacterized protein n=2 Tax=Drosophila navojoa TaxID=7232 RepID=A0A484B3N6_DRONA|nr:hypothetical protein AWZ03_010247 [Drosophila navojoa]